MIEPDPEWEYTEESAQGMWVSAERHDAVLAALLELHRTVTEYDGSDCDEARLEDAIAEAQRLAPYVPEPPSKDGF